jgi:hypothetical protein
MSGRPTWRPSASHERVSHVEHERMLTVESPRTMLISTSGLSHRTHRVVAIGLLPLPRAVLHDKRPYGGPHRPPTSRSEGTDRYLVSKRLATATALKAMWAKMLGPSRP